MLQAELEIGEVFEEWQHASTLPLRGAALEPSPAPPPPPPPAPPPRQSSRSKLLPVGPQPDHEGDAVTPRRAANGVAGDATPPRGSRLSSKRRSRRGRASRRYNTDSVVAGQDWSEDVLADFHDLVLQELATLAADHAVSQATDEDAGAMRFRVSHQSRSLSTSPASPSSPSPSPEEPRPSRARWLRRRVADDDAVLVSITPLPEDDSQGATEVLVLRSLPSALPDLLPARRAATLPAPRPTPTAALATVKRAAVRSAGPDLIADDASPGPQTANGGVSDLRLQIIENLSSPARKVKTVPCALPCCSSPWLCTTYC